MSSTERLLATTHVQDAVAADSAFERLCSGRFLRNYTDAGGLLGNQADKTAIVDDTGFPETGDPRGRRHFDVTSLLIFAG
jgi:hypothetical protein